ncbi:hypothetical protein OAP01_00770 [Akkermansiaceae bacterium]|nr:hypothetical protein [Akkermansiaceae bacterium]
MIGDPKFAKPLNYWVFKVKNLKQTLKQDLDSLMARKKGSASTVMLSEEQLKDICGEGSLVCVPRRWLKELGFDPEQERKARVLGVHPDGKEVWEYTDWRTIEDKAREWDEQNWYYGEVMELVDRWQEGELDFDVREIQWMDFVNYVRARKADLYTMGPEMEALMGEPSVEQIHIRMRSIIDERLISHGFHTPTTSSITEDEEG